MRRAEVLPLIHVLVGYGWGEGDSQQSWHRRLAGVKTHPDTGETPVPQQGPDVNMSSSLMMKLADRIFEFFASLKLAIVLILSLALFLAGGTIYEARYGAAAAQSVVYGSTAFLTLMSLLAINVLAAALSRFPWKRKQTGFLITHLGIEVLLAGCLISYRSAIDGRIALHPNDIASSIDLNTEQLSVSLPTSSQRRTWSIPVDLWSEAGFPSIWRLFAGAIEALPKETNWPAGRTVGMELGDGARIEVLDWLPAAKLDRRFVPEPGGRPAVEIHLAGSTPMGMAVNEQQWIHSGAGNGSSIQLFGGVIETSLWQARSDGEAAQFLHPPTVDQLPGAGRIDCLLDASGTPTSVDVAAAMEKELPIGTSGFRVKVNEYFPQAQVKDDHLVKAGDDPIDPIVQLHMSSSSGQAWEYILSARDPYLSTCSDAKTGAAASNGPLLLYQHPQAIVTHRQGERGRLQLLQTRDGKLLARRFGLHGLEDAFEVEVGKARPAWMGLTITIDQVIPAARLLETYRHAHPPAGKIDEAMRAMKIALIVDGQRTEAWLARGAAVKAIETPRGAAALSYGFDGYSLPFKFSLISAEMRKDPGSQNPASYTSVVSISDAEGGRSTDSITMNEPLTSGGLTFYQAGFDDSVPGNPITVLSVRRDPGWILKYAGCALIVGGIFTMFYMKAYFQKPATSDKAIASTGEWSSELLEAI